MGSAQGFASILGMKGAAVGAVRIQSAGACQQGDPGPPKHPEMFFRCSEVCGSTGNIRGSLNH